VGYWVTSYFSLSQQNHFNVVACSLELPCFGWPHPGLYLHGVLRHSVNCRLGRRSTEQRTGKGNVVLNFLLNVLRSREHNCPTLGGQCCVELFAERFAFSRTQLPYFGWPMLCWSFCWTFCLLSNTTALLWVANVVLTFLLNVLLALEHNCPALGGQCCVDLFAERFACSRTQLPYFGWPMLCWSFCWTFCLLSNTTAQLWVANVVLTFLLNVLLALEHITALLRVANVVLLICHIYRPSNNRMNLSMKC
jgi:hypothetical protein